MWLVWVDADTNSPYEFNDKSVRDAYLANLPTTTKAISTRYDVLQRETETFGVMGGTDLPKPTPHMPAIDSSNRIHYHRKK